MYIYKIDRLGRRYRIHHRLTPRDREILKFIRDTKPTTTTAIRERFWPGQSDNHHHLRRLRVLRSMGLIELQEWLFMESWRVNLTEQGLKKVATG